KGGEEGHPQGFRQRVPEQRNSEEHRTECGPGQRTTPVDQSSRHGPCEDRSARDGGDQPSRLSRCGGERRACPQGQQELQDVGGAAGEGHRWKDLPVDGRVRPLTVERRILAHVFRFLTDAVLGTPRRYRVRGERSSGATAHPRGSPRTVSQAVLRVPVQQWLLALLTSMSASVVGVGSSWRSRMLILFSFCSCRDVWP